MMGNTHSALSRKGERVRGSTWRSKAAASAARCATQPRPTQQAQQCAIAGIARNSLAVSDEPTVAKPGREIFRADALPWIEVHGEIPRFAKRPD
jgi:hypothetical protein